MNGRVEGAEGRPGMKGTWVCVDDFWGSVSGSLEHLKKGGCLRIGYIG